MAPALSGLHGAGAADRLRHAFERAVRLLSAMSFPLTGAALALGPALIGVLYGDRYRGSGEVLVVLLVAFPMVPLGLLGATALGGVDRLRYLIYADLVAALVNVALDIVLIPSHGARGAAWANVAAQVTGASLAVLLARRAMNVIEWQPSSILRAACVGMAVWLAARSTLAVFGGVTGVLVGSLAAALTLAAVAVPAGLIRRDDAQWLAAAAGARGRGVPRRFAMLFAR